MRLIAIARTHHATRTFRLACGCLRDYPGMSSSRSHDVLCPACDKPTTTLYAYPANRCGREHSLDGERYGKRVHVKCTKAEHPSSAAHYDSLTEREWHDPAKLRRAREGKA